MGKKKGAKKVTEGMTPAQRAAADKRALERKEQQQLAQIVNLHIAGYSLAQIGSAIGATPDEVDRMINSQATRYIKSQPALRAYVRNFISSKHTELLEPLWPMATDPKHKDFFEAQDRALRVLDKMAKLHGAEAPVQKEITLDAAPEAVENMVNALMSQRGQAYDESVFDDEEVHEAVVIEDEVDRSHRALEAASDAVEQVSRNPEEDTL